VPIRYGNEPADRVIYVIARGWHTDIGIPIEEAGGRLISFPKSFPGVRYLVFGFGNRDYLLSNRGNFGDMLRALLPGPGAVLVTALRETPQEAFGSDNVVRIHLTRAGLRNLTQFVSDPLETAGEPRPIAEGPYPGSLFYASPVSYSAFYTCNTWTAEALRRAELPVRSTGILFTDQLMEQVRQLSAAEAFDSRSVAAR
jgi:hypothetical protein